MSLASPKQNTTLPLTVQRRVDAMFAGTSVGLSGPEMLEYFSRFDATIEQYPWSGGAPSRKQILQDCLSRFSKEQQLDILVDLLRPENFQKYPPPSPEDQRFLLEWVASQKQGLPAPPTTRPIPSAPTPLAWDVFVSHASEDKEAFAKPLALALQERGVRVWFDAFTLSLGDSLRRSIDRGLAQSRFGIVVLSEAFFQKHWPQLELDGLVARESAGTKVILPIWHGIDEARVRAHSPTLADRLAVSSAHGLEHVVQQVLEAIGPRSMGASFRDLLPPDPEKKDSKHGDPISGKQPYDWSSEVGDTAFSLARKGLRILYEEHSFDPSYDEAAYARNRKLRIPEHPFLVSPRGFVKLHELDYEWIDPRNRNRRICDGVITEVLPDGRARMSGNPFLLNIIVDVLPDDFPDT